MIFIARNDGVHRTTVRNANLTKNQIGNVQRHNEREKESYVNQDIVPERTPLNVHFKTPSGSYQEIFDAMVEEKTISTRGLKADACLFGELIFDVNSAYFHNHGGYEYARQFYADAYQAAVDIVGGEQYILSAVMHADERNRAMSEALGQDVYHYHLHVVYIPVVEKQILWSKRCKDKSLVGTVKETIMQVSSSKKWLSKPALDEAGNPILQRNGKPILKKSYSALQDDFFQHMRAAGYTDVKRGERGSSEEHLTVTQFKVMQEEKRLEGLTERIQRKMTQAEQALRTQSMTFMKIDSMGKKTLTGNIAFAPDEARELKELAQKGVTADSRLSQMEEKVARAQKDAGIWKRRYEKLLDQVQDYLTAVKKAPERVADFLRRVIQERDIPQRRQPIRTHQHSVER